MKKLILAAVTVGAFASGAAFAQATTGVQPGYTHPELGPQIYGNSGWTPDQAAPYGSVYSFPNVLNQALILSDGRYVLPQYQQAPQYQIASPYPRTSRDRDGDGVRNSRDNYPNDPRYR
jgi:hypothetical protein